jgi:hypothetical protein
MNPRSPHGALCIVRACILPQSYSSSYSYSSSLQAHDQTKGGRVGGGVRER